TRWPRDWSSDVCSSDLQMVTYAPHFISTVVMVGLILQMLNPRFGILAQLTNALGLQPISAMARPELYQPIYVFTDIWQHMGFARSEERRVGKECRSGLA